MTSKNKARRVLVPVERVAGKDGKVVVRPLTGTLVRLPSERLVQATSAEGRAELRRRAIQRKAAA